MTDLFQSTTFCRHKEVKCTCVFISSLSCSSTIKGKLKRSESLSFSKYFYFGILQRDIL